MGTIRQQRCIDPSSCYVHYAQHRRQQQGNTCERGAIGLSPWKVAIAESSNICLPSVRSSVMCNFFGRGHEDVLDHTPGVNRGSYLRHKICIGSTASFLKTSCATALAWCPIIAPSTSSNNAFLNQPAARRLHRDVARATARNTGDESGNFAGSMGSRERSQRGTHRRKALR